MKRTVTFLSSLFFTLTASLSVVAQNHAQPSQGNLIIVDTRDTNACLRVIAQMPPGFLNRGKEEPCTFQPENPYLAILAVPEVVPSQHTGEYKIAELSAATVQHANNLRNILLINTVAFFRLLSLPSEDTGWRKPRLENVPNAWQNNVTRPPVIDEDSFFTNYIQHPIAGATYFSIARHSGFSFKESLGFSVFVSTIVWEYGMEAIVERPSINDILATPALGALIGELTYQIDKKIQQNGGELLGGQTLGTLARITTNPGYYVSEGINEVLGKDMFSHGTAHVQFGPRRHLAIPPSQKYYPKLPEVSITIRLWLKP